MCKSPRLPLSSTCSSTCRHATGVALKTGLSFMDSWTGSSELLTAFTDWLQLVYSTSRTPQTAWLLLMFHPGEEEKSRREGYSASCPAGRAPTPDADKLVNPAGSVTANEPAPPDESRSPDEPELSSEPTTPSGPATHESLPTDVPPTPPPAVPALDPPGPGQTPTAATSIMESTSSPATPERTSSPTIHSPSPNTPSSTTPPLMTPMQPQTVPNIVTPTPPTIPQTVPSIIPPAPAPGTETLLFEYDRSYPEFITADVIKHLNSVNGGLRWVEMVRIYLELECNHPSRVGRDSQFLIPFVY
jgi:hypothetical protein